jgi:Cellulose binding domain
MSRHRKRPAPRHQASRHQAPKHQASERPERPIATAAPATAFSTAVRRVVVTPTFAAGLGVVIAAAMSYPMTRTVISYGGTPPVGGSRCQVTDCGTGAADGNGSLATASPGSQLAPPTPAATHPDPSAPATSGGGTAASSPRPAMQYQTLRQWQSGFIGQVTITVPGGAPDGWQLRLSYQSASIIGVWGGHWSPSGDHTVLVTPESGSTGGHGGGDSVQVILAVDGMPGPPSGCTFNGRACRPGLAAAPTRQESPQRDSRQQGGPDQGGGHQQGNF